jgi:hypothetical protein
MRTVMLAFALVGVLVTCWWSPARAQGNVPVSEIESLKAEIRRLRERLERLEQANEPRGAPAAAQPHAPMSAQPPAAAAQPGPTAPSPAPGERELTLEREHPLELLGLPKPEIAGVRFGGFFSGSASYNSHVQMVPEFAGGGAALADPKNTNFRFDTFTFGVAKTFASWLSVGATIEVESHRDRHVHGFDPDFGCPGAGLCIEQFGAEEAETEIELHRFHITGIAPLGNGLALAFGRFDVPFGFERHDQNLLLTATTSEVFQFGRPNSMTGFQASYQVAPWLDLTAWVANRWENETTHDPFDDNNRAKSFGGRLGITPLPGRQLLNVGIGGWWGAEQDDNSADPRWMLAADATWRPVRRLILAGEIVYGGESGVSFRERGIPFAAPAVSDKSVNWWGFYALAHYDLLDWLGLTFRYGFFRDEDGARTGVEQTLQSWTIAPVLHLTRLVPDLRSLGVTYPRTAHPLDWVDVKLEYRLNHSSKPVFSDARPGVDILDADRWGHQVQLQFVVNY